MLRFIVLVLLMIVSGCGLHPRGEMPLAPPLKKMYLQTNDPYGPLARILKNYLKSSGVHMTDSPATANTVLIILDENTSQVLASISGTQQTRQYNLVLTITFEIAKPNGEILVPTQALSEMRTITVQSTQLLGGSNEATTLYQQMRSAIAFDLMNRISSNDIRKLVTRKPR